MTTIQLPEIVGEAEWRAAHEALLAKEKAATRARDALAAERRRQPMLEIPSGFEFDGPERARRASSTCSRADRS